MLVLLGHVGLISLLSMLFRLITLSKEITFWNRGLLCFSNVLMLICLKRFTVCLCFVFPFSLIQNYFASQFPIKCILPPVNKEMLKGQIFFKQKTVVEFTRYQHIQFSTAQNLIIKDHYFGCKLG